MTKFTDMTDDSIRTMVEYARDRESQIRSLAESTGRSADEIRAVADGDGDGEEPEKAAPKPNKGWTTYDWTQLDPKIRAGLTAGKTVMRIARDLDMPDQTVRNHILRFSDRFPRPEKPKPEPEQKPEPKPPPEPEPEPLASNEERNVFLDQLRAVLSVIDWRVINVWIDAGDSRIEISTTRRNIP